MKRIYFIIFFLIIGFVTAQNSQRGLGGLSVVSDEKKELIDRFINVSDYENNLKNFAASYLIQKTMEYNSEKQNFESISDENIDKIWEWLNFEKFKSVNIYGSMADLSEKELQNLIELYSGNNPFINKSNQNFFTNSIIINHLIRKLD